VQSPPLSIAREIWERAMRETAEHKLEWVEFKLDQELNQRVLELTERKYSREEYYRKR